MINSNDNNVLENNTHNLQWDFDIHTDHQILARRPDLILINKKKKKKKKKKKRNYKIVALVVLADNRIKLKEFERKDKYLVIVMVLKKLWNMEVTIIPIVIVEFGTVTKGLLKGLGDFKVGGVVETIQTTALLRTTRILRRFWRLEETCCHSKSSGKPSANADVKNCKEVNNNNNNHLIYAENIYLPKMKKEFETLIQEVRIHCQGKGVEFGIEECAMKITRKGKRHDRKSKTT